MFVCKMKTSVPTYDEDLSASFDEHVEEDIQSILSTKNDINIDLDQKYEKKKRIFKNDIQGLNQKLLELKLVIAGYNDDIPFVETLTVTSDDPLMIENVNDDLERESSFYKQTLKNVTIASDLYSDAGLPYKRPEDFFAEMIKTDDHMQKVKATLLKEKRLIDESTERRRVRDQKRAGNQTRILKEQQRKKTT